MVYVLYIQMIDLVKNKNEQKYLLEEINVPENRGRVSIFDRLDHLKKLVDMPTTWSVVDIQLKNVKCFMNQLRNLIAWNQKYRYTEQSGYYICLVYVKQKIFNEIELSDSPDSHAMSEIKGSDDLSQINISGDIGRCTTIAIMQRLQNIHDLWLSVLDNRSTILVRVLLQLQTKNINQHFGVITSSP